LSPKAILSGRSDGVIVCPLTSDIIDVEWTRPKLSASNENGLRKDSQVMADKVQVVHLRRIGSRVGRVSNEDLRRIEFSLRLVLGFLD